MEKKLVKKTLRQLEIPELREAIGGGGRLRVPGGYTDDGEPLYIDGDESTAESARLWKPS